ncbi:MAG: response regulator [Desulfobacteraceae bacterium]|nr:response regulator [Desulfobacteraceae bacterium]
MDNGAFCIYEDHVLAYETVYQLYMRSPTPIRLIDLECHVLTQNPAMDALIGMRNPETLRKKCHEITLAPGFCHTDDCPIKQLTRDAKKDLLFFYECELFNGIRFPGRVTSSPFYDNNGRLAGVVQTIQDDTHYVAMAEALEQKNRQLSDSYQSLERHYKVIRVLNETTHLVDMSARLLSILIENTASATGVFYVWDKKRRLLTPVATHALFVEPPEFGLGQGIPGQAAQEKRTILLKGVPADYLKIKSGAINAMPFCVMCVPMLLKDEVLGVIELSSFSDLSQHRDYLENILPQTCLAIRNAINTEEIFQLSEAMQKQNEKLNAQNEELQAQSEELLAQSEEIQAQTEELMAQRDTLEKKTREAEDANRMKSVFLSNMSHELRTPLNSILGLARLMLDDYQVISDGRHKEYLEIMLRNGENLLELINDILDLTRIESGREEMRFTSVKTKDLLEKLSLSIAPLAQKKDLSFDMQLADCPETIITDQRRLNQILINLLGNAVKFTEKGGITLRCSKKIETDKDYAIFEVADTGVGIPEGYEQLIFEPFKQVDGSYTRKYGGTGLGLSISQKLAQMLGGSVSVSSVLGQGSIFTLILPVDRRNKNRLPDEIWKKRLKEALLPPASNEPANQTPSEQSSPGPKKTTAPAPPSLAPPDTQAAKTDEAPLTSLAMNATGQKLLIVDDDMLVLKELGAKLKSYGYGLSCAFDGNVGIKLLKEERPDLVLLDLTMPIMDGFSFLHEMQKLSDVAATPVVILSAADLDSETKRLLPANVKGVLQKGSIKSQDLLSLLQSVLEEGSRIVSGAASRSGEACRPGQEEDKPQKKILIAEDNDDNMFLLKEILMPCGYEILHAKDGRQAINLAMTGRPSVILMDIQMPEMNGLDATRAIRESGRKTPIIALTAKAMKGDREQILEAGCNDYICKPFTPTSLLRTIEYWLNPGKTDNIK